MSGKILRLIHFLLDTAIYVIIIVAFIFVFRDYLAQEKVKWISILVYFFYYFFFEYFKGQTPGKLITRSKVVSLTENKEFYFIQILLRTLMRFIPLDIISYLFAYRGLHDWISKTTIIKL